MVNNYSFNAFEHSGASTSGESISALKGRFVNSIVLRVKSYVKMLGILRKYKPIREIDSRIPLVVLGYLSEVHLIINSRDFKSCRLLTWLTVRRVFIKSCHD